MNTAGYSGTPLANKPGIKGNSKIKLVNQSDYYFKLFKDLPGSVNVMSDSKTKKDLIHYFTKSADKLHSDIQNLRTEIE